MDTRDYEKLYAPTLDLVGCDQHSYNDHRILCLGDQGNDDMTLEESKEMAWNLLGAFSYLCVGIGAVFHTILGY